MIDGRGGVDATGIVATCRRLGLEFPDESTLGGEGVDRAVVGRNVEGAIGGNGGSGVAAFSRNVIAPALDPEGGKGASDAFVLFEVDSSVRRDGRGGYKTGITGGGGPFDGTVGSRA